MADDLYHKCDSRIPSPENLTLEVVDELLNAMPDNGNPHFEKLRSARAPWQSGGFAGFPGPPGAPSRARDHRSLRDCPHSASLAGY
jgi:hypothetical protein